jgi:broad specificity phosphatase PhoE
MGQSNLKLTTRGLAQARSVAQTIDDTEAINALYSSPLTRARETAEFLSERLGLPVKIINELKEIDIGPLEGLNSAERQEQYPEFIAQWNKNPVKASLSGVEPLDKLQHRAWKALNCIVAAHKDQETIAIISHSLLITTVICKVLSLPLGRFRDIRVDLASISILQYRNNSFLLKDLNILRHLPHSLLPKGQD